jgi:hypothetical protein
MWQPEPKPRLVLSITRRFRIRRTAGGFALYDYALGERVSLHRTKSDAIRRKEFEKTMLRQVRDQVKTTC